MKFFTVLFSLFAVVSTTFGTITTNPPEINFIAAAGSTPAAQNVTVTTSNGVAWTTHDASVWFHVSPPNGANNSQISITFPYNIGNYAPNTYVEYIYFNASGSSETALKVTMVLTSGPPGPTPVPTVSPIPTSSPSPTRTPTPSPSPISGSASVTLAWNRNVETNIAGYKLYYGNAPRTYDQIIDVADSITRTVSNLGRGITYYFAVKAYNNAGIEGPFSNEVSFIDSSSTPTPNPTVSPSPTKTPSPAPTASPSPTRTPTPSPTKTPSPTASPSPTRTPSPSPSPSPSPTASITPTPTASPTVSPMISPSASPTSPPTPSPSPAPSIRIIGNASICADISQNPVSDVTMTLTGDVAISTLTDEAGNYMFDLLQGNYIVTPSKTRIEPTTGGIDTADIIAIQNHFLGFVPLVGCQLIAGDVNTDNSINTIDVVAIQRFYLGVPTGLASVGKHKFIPDDREYNDIVEDQIDQDFDTIVIGDVTKPFIQSTAQTSRNATAKMAASTVDTLSLPNISISPKSRNLVIPIKVSYVGSKSKIVGFQGDFTFDSSLITFDSMPVQKAGLTAGNWTVAGNVISSRGNLKTLRISAFANDLKPLISSGTLFELRVNQAKKSNKIAQLIWKASPDNFVFIDTETNKQEPSALNTGSLNIKDK